MISGNDGGFTFVELLVGFVVVGLLLTIAIPLIGGDIDDAKGRAAARTLAADLRWLRSEAIARGRETALGVDIDANRYVREADGVQRPLPSAFAAVFVPAVGATVREEARIRFRADGTSSGGSVHLVRGDRRYGVDVSWPMGRIRVRE